MGQFAVRNFWTQELHDVAADKSTSDRCSVAISQSKNWKKKKLMSHAVPVLHSHKKSILLVSLFFFLGLNNEGDAQNVG